MDAPVDLGAVKGARKAIKSALRTDPGLGPRTGAFMAGELTEGPMADDTVTRIRSDLVKRAGEVRDKLNAQATGPWRVTQKAVLEEALSVGLDAIERRPPASPPALAAPTPKPKAAKPAPADPPAAPKAAPARAKRSSREKPAGSLGGQRLRAWRDARGLTQGAAAPRFEARQIQVSRWETAPWDGPKDKPTAKWRDVLASETGIDPDAWDQPPPNGEEG